MAVKKIEGVNEAALVIDGRFTRALVSKSLPEVLRRGLDPILSQELDDNSEVHVEVVIRTAEEIARETAQASARPAVPPAPEAQGGQSETQK